MYSLRGLNFKHHEFDLFAGMLFNECISTESE